MNKDKVVENLKLIKKQFRKYDFTAALDYAIEAVEGTKEFLSVPIQFDDDKLKELVSGLKEQIEKGEIRLYSVNWISVHDRLPEEGERVLICADVDDEEDKIAIAYRMIREWTEDEWIWRAWETLGHSVDYEDEEVIAWMPLPEPYEVEHD